MFFFHKFTFSAEQVTSRRTFSARGGGGGVRLHPTHPPCLRACIKSYIAHTLKFPFYIQKLKTDSECSATFVKLIWPSLIKYIFANRILLFLFYKPRNLWGAKRDNIVQLYIYGNKKNIYIYQPKICTATNNMCTATKNICTATKNIYTATKNICTATKICIRHLRIYIWQRKYIYGNEKYIYGIEKYIYGNEKYIYGNEKYIYCNENIYTATKNIYMATIVPAYITVTEVASLEVSWQFSCKFANLQPGWK